MNKKSKVSILLLVFFATVACEENFASDSNESSVDSSSDVILSPQNQPQSSNPDENTYNKIYESWVNEDVFSKSVNYSLDSTLSLSEANELVNNDLTNNYNQVSRTKFSSIERTKKECYVTENHSTATYSIKERFEEKCTVSKFDSENRWKYSRTSEDSKNVYFVEDDLVRHIVNEQLYFYKDNYLYCVYAESSYYEGKEDKGIYKSYYQKIGGLSEEEIDSYFYIRPMAYSYFGNSGLSKIEKKLGSNLINSTSYYTIEDYDILSHQTNYSFASKGSGCFDCYSNDACSYYFDNLRDYPSTEETILSSISYEQKYLLNISNYSSFTENFITTSVSKNKDGKTLRNEIRQGNKIQGEECEIFYPDLSKFAEKEYEPTINK